MPETKKKKQFRMLDCIMAVVCVVLTAEAAAPAAAIGNSQYFWWIFLLITFCLPYSMVSAELGTTYEGEGGLYDWVSRAFGHRWGTRVAWYYWVNFPLWMASVSVFFTDNFETLFAWQPTVLFEFVIRLVFIWALVGLSLLGAAENKTLFNIGTVCKILIMGLLGFAGIYSAFTRGMANSMELSSFLPGFNIRSLSFISVIIFNFMGFEVVTTFVNQMENPKKQIPQAILVGGAIITLFYLLASFGIGVAIPVDQISTSAGILDALVLLIPNVSGWLIMIIGIMLLFAMFVNQLSWSFGINFVARYSAQSSGGMPRIFKVSTKNGIPKGAALMNGIVASILVLIAPFIPSQELFWSFFALNLVTLLLSYVPLFPAFLKLRQRDAHINRPYKIVGGKKTLYFIAYVPMVLLILSILLTIMPLGLEEIAEKGPLLAGVGLALASGEYYARRAEP